MARHEGYPLSPEGVDALDYDEADCYHAHRPKRGIDTEEGEVMSGEDGEIKDATPPHGRRRRKSETTKDSSRGNITLSSYVDQKEKQNHNICRHFLQGRCSWGSECRFLHETSPENDAGASGSSRSPVEYPRHRISYRKLRPHPGPDPLSREYAPGSYDVLHHSHFRHPPHYWPASIVRGGVAPPHNGIEKEEESEGWHRLRTITSGWDSDDDDDIEKSNYPHTLLKKRRYSSDSNSDTSTSSEGKKRKKKSKKSRRAKQKGMGEEWVDPWSRKKVARDDSSSDEDQRERRLRKAKFRIKTYANEDKMMVEESRDEKIRKELERVTRKIEKKKSHQRVLD